MRGTMRAVRLQVIAHETQDFLLEAEVEAVPRQGDSVALRGRGSYFVDWVHWNVDDGGAWTAMVNVSKAQPRD